MHDRPINHNNRVSENLDHLICWRMQSAVGFLILWLPLTLAASSSIRVNKACYLSSDPIVVTFNDANLQPGDWIAIFRSTDSDSNLVNFITWAWTCGSQSCTNNIASGNVTLPNGLTSGLSYKAALLRNSNNVPFTPLAVSPVFSVINSGQSCAQAAKSAAAHVAIEQIRTIVRGMIANDVTLTAQFLRMIFHDCIDVCDGCIDLTNPDNAGLDKPINRLNPLVQQFANEGTGLSRADVWAVAAVLGVDVADHGIHNNPIFFVMNSIGRQDCEVANKVCLDASGKQVHCGALHGPHRVAPTMNLNTSGVFGYLETHFNLNQRQAVAALGAHSVGSLHRQNSGIDGPDGWNIHNTIFHSEYYQALLGTATASDSDQTKILVSPNWKRALQDNTHFTPKRPTRHMWHLFVQGKKLTMLDADIAIVRNLDDTNMNPSTGVVGCGFNPATVPAGVRVCPAASTISIAAEFLDNDTFLSEFKSVLNMIVTNGYKETNCGFKVCPLVRK